MPEVLFKQVSYTVAYLMEQIRLGILGLPDIQRPFVWSATKVRDLFDSMYRGFPVGQLLLWESGVSGGQKQIGADTKQKVPGLLIVDGQQRLTALYAVLNALPVVGQDYVPVEIRIAFCPRDQTFKVTDAATVNDPEFIADISEVFSHGAPYSYIAKFMERLKGHREVTPHEEERLSAAIDRLFHLKSYPLTALELPATVDEEQVAEVFVRINSSGVILKQSDFILTLMSVFWDDGRVALERFCRACRQPSESGPSPYNYFIKPLPDDLLLVDVALGFRRARLRHVYSILRGKDLETEEFSDERRRQQFEVLERSQASVLDLQNWHEFLKCLMLAGFRGHYMISSHVGLMYSYAMFLIGRRDFGVPLPDLKKALARWFFMVSLTSRYSASPETAMEQDLARVRGLSGPAAFIAALDAVIRDTLTEDYWNITLPNQLATSASRSPALFAYYAALNLQDARVLFSQLKVSDLFDPALKPKKSALERHHLFPRGYLATLGVTELREVNQIANLALLEWPDNIAVSDDAPAVYFPRLAAERGLDARQRHLHALPDSWETMGYDDFLATRRKAMAKVVREGFERLG